MSKVAVGLSGGIDSGTTALMLKEQGYEVMGVTMWLFDHQTGELEAAKRVAQAIGIEHHILDYREAFKSQVIHAFIAQYEQGLTPNPCILCNRVFKYGKLIEDCVALGADFFATGHYVRVDYDATLGEYQLFRAKNRSKDQSYNLYHLSQETLSRLVLPLGTKASKDEVRAHFAALNLELAQKKDSLGICFIEHKNHSLFLSEIQSPAMQKGNFIDKDGHVLGYHDGTAGFTIGQKRRLGVDLKGQYLNGKYVVTELRPSTNEVVLGTEDDLSVYEITCSDFKVVSPTLKNQLIAETHKTNPAPLDVEVIVSQWSTVYQGKLSLCEDPSNAKLLFEMPVRAPAKGQALVCYIGERLIGGGIIS